MNRKKHRNPNGILKPISHCIIEKQWFSVKRALANPGEHWILVQNVFLWGYSEFQLCSTFSPGFWSSECLLFSPLFSTCYFQTQSQRGLDQPFEWLLLLLSLSFLAFPYMADLLFYKTPSLCPIFYWLIVYSLSHTLSLSLSHMYTYPHFVFSIYTSIIFA